MDSKPQRAGQARTSALRTALLFLACACVAATDAGAQDPEALPMTRREVLEQLFGGLTPESPLRVVTLGGEAQIGRLGSAGLGAVDMLQGGALRSIEYQDVRTVQVQGGHALQGTIWGAASGAVVGIFFGAMYASFDCRTQADCRYTEEQGALRWGTFLGVVGGGIGFFTGRRSRHWHPIFP